MLLYDPPNIFDKAVRGFQREIKAATIPAPDWLNSGSWRFISWFQRQGIPFRNHGEQEPDWLNTLQNPKTLRYQKSTRGPFQHPQQSAPFSPWLVELARFEVPYGGVGFVRDFQQFLADENETWSGVNHWGDFRIPYSVRWVFRLDRFNGTHPEWINTTGIPTLPGEPYPDQPDETDLWFPVHNRQTVRWTVPGGFMLRVFCQTDTLQARLTVAARVRGELQTAYSCQAAINLRSVW